MTEITFAAAVRTIRRRQGLTQAQLGAGAHLSRSQVIKIEKGGVRVPTVTYSKLVAALGYTYGADLIAAATEVTA
jgi:transcriptional regulator with XRE-family HTH domain